MCKSSLSLLLFLFLAPIVSTSVLAEVVPLETNKNATPKIEQAVFSPTYSTFHYLANWTKLNVGSGKISVATFQDYVTVEYRMNFEVRVFGARAYYLDSHQQIIFDSNGKLIESVTAADIDGDKSSGTVKLSNNQYVVDFDGKKSIINSKDFVFTTMSGVYRIPLSGPWLDLTNGQIVKYSASKNQEIITLKRPDGSDELKYDNNNLLKEISSSVKVGSVIIKRVETPLNTLKDLIPEDKQILENNGLRKQQKEETFDN